MLLLYSVVKDSPNYFIDVMIHLFYLNVMEVNNQKGVNIKRLSHFISMVTTHT